MLSYFLQRLTGACLVVLGVVSIVFLLIHLVPGDPVEIMLGESASAADRQALRSVLGLDRPLPVQVVGENGIGSLDAVPGNPRPLPQDASYTVNDLDTGDVRFTFAALEPGVEPEGLHWLSFIDQLEDPVCRDLDDVAASTNACTTFTIETDPDAIPDSARKVQDPVAIGKVPRVQATYERGPLSANADGTWTYTLSDDPGDPAALDNMHRICIQLDLASFAGNPCIDFIPSQVTGDGTTGTSLDALFYEMNPSKQVVATESCNSCHSEIAFHGGNRREMDYCATCHNLDTTDANSANSQDFAVLTHRIHYSANIPSVAAGTPYKIWGFRNGEHDYSDISYPQDVRHCTRCHAGQEDFDAAAAAGQPPPLAQSTPDGHNWASIPSWSTPSSRWKRSRWRTGRPTSRRAVMPGTGSVERSHTSSYARRCHPGMPCSSAAT